MGRVRGTVKWFDPEKGWGFIRLDSGQEVFVHHSDIQGEGFRTLKDGEPVELEVEEADRGPRARKVTEPGGEVAAAPAAPEAGARRKSTGGRREARAPSGSGRTEARDRTPARPDRTLDELVRSALGDRYPFLR